MYTYTHTYLLITRRRQNTSISRVIPNISRARRHHSIRVYSTPISNTDIVTSDALQIQRLLGRARSATWTQIQTRIIPSWILRRCSYGPASLLRSGNQGTFFTTNQGTFFTTCPSNPQHIIITSPEWGV